MEGGGLRRPPLIVYVPAGKLKLLDPVGVVMTCSRNAHACRHAQIVRPRWDCSDLGLLLVGAYQGRVFVFRWFSDDFAIDVHCFLIILDDPKILTMIERRY